jgi:AMP nucleosidase
MPATVITTQSFTDAQAALAHARAIYDSGIAFLRSSLQDFVAGADLQQRVRACYPFVRVRVDTVARADSRLAYGFVAGPGVYETTLTRPELFRHYYHEQFELLLRNHGVALEVGLSSQPIPVHFSLGEGDHLEGSLTPQRRLRLSDLFDLPDLAAMDDGIANGTHEPSPGADGAVRHPLALFTAPRVDYSLHRLRHYTGTVPQHFQNFVLFTNYQFYIDEFVRLGARADGRCGQRVHRLRRARQRGDAAHRSAAGAGRRCGRAAAATAADAGLSPEAPMAAASPWSTSVSARPMRRTSPTHVAVLRPHAWLMLGHCAGLRNSQQLGDYVLAHAYVREDHVLDDDLPVWVPIPALAEVQVALAEAVAEVTSCPGYELKRIMRTGTVATIDNRNWELRDKAARCSGSARAAPSRWTWKVPPSPPTVSASACPTARCCASPTSRCMAN